MMAHYTQGQIPFFAKPHTVNRLKMHQQRTMNFTDFELNVEFNLSKNVKLRLNRK